MASRPARLRVKKGPPELPEGPPSPLGLPGRFPAITTADDFRRAAIHIFGVHGWVGETSRCLGVNESTLWRWVNEQIPFKPYALAAMSAWLRIFMLTGERPPEMGEDA
jgi:hypothetical protein